MDINEESKLMDKVSDVLRDINKSEKNIEKSYFSMSLFEIKHRNKTNKILEKKDDATLSVSEKVRYGKIGDNFIKGASEEYIKIIEKIKKEARKKNKEKEQKLQQLQIQESEDFKKEIKKSKKLSKSKMILIGGAIVATTFLIKKTYDFLVKQNNKFNFSKYLFDYFPKKISFVKSKIDKMDENASSFVLETTGGEKVNLTEKSQSKNTIEEAAKTFDNILKTYVFDKGINKIINSIKDDDSVVGYLLFKPAGIIINKLMRFTKEALTTNKYFYGMGADLFHGIQTILSPFIDIDEELNKKFVGKYKSLMITSHDGYTKAIAKLDKMMRDATPTERVIPFGGAISLGGFEGREIELRVSGLSDFGKNAAQVATSNPKDFLELFKKLRGFKGLKRGEIETRGNAGISAKVDYDTGELDKIRFVVDTPSGTSHITTGKGFIFFGTPEDKAIEYGEMLSRHPEIHRYTKLFEDSISKLPDIMLEIRAWHGYNEKFLRPRENMLELMNKDVEIYNTNTIESYTDYMIYSQKNLKTQDKFYWIIQQYFDTKNKSKNFFLNYLENMKTRSEWARLKSMSLINHFAITIDPLYYLKDEKNNLIGDFFNNSKVKILSEHNDQYGSIGSGETIMIYKLSNFSNKKLELENLLYSILMRTQSLLYAQHKRYVKYYKSAWNTNQMVKIDTQYITPSNDGDISIKYIISKDVYHEIKENPFK